MAENKGLKTSLLKGEQTNLRSLKYSEYRNGSPIIEDKIGNKYNQINSRTTDTERLGKLLLSKQGLKFQANQALLYQYGNELNLKNLGKSKKGKFNFKELGKRIGKQVLNTVINNAKTTLSILAQVPVNGTGTHFIQGLGANGYLREGGREEASTGLGRFIQKVKDFADIGGGVDGASKALKGQTISGRLEDGGILNNSQFESDLSIQNSELGSDVSSALFAKYAAPLGAFANKAIGSLSKPPFVSNALSRFNSLGTPSLATNSLSGKSKNPELGSLLDASLEKVQLTEPTNSKPFDRNNGYLNSDDENAVGTTNSGRSKINVPISTRIATENDALLRKLVNDGTTTRSNRKGLVGEAGWTDPKPDTSDLNVYRPVGSKKNETNYINSNITLRNRYNKGGTNSKPSLYPDAIGLLAEQTQSILGRSEVEDIIPFEFQIITPDDDERFIYFRAFLDNLADNYTGDWSGERYVGRAEQFYTYQGFDRTVDFSFKIAAFSREELIPMYQKINGLVSTTAPTYNSEGSYMKGTLTAVTIGNYLNNVKGFITSVNLNWNTSYQWETNNQSGDTKNPLVPHVLDCSIAFTPIHNFNVNAEKITSKLRKYVGGRNATVSGETGDFGVSPDTGRDFSTNADTVINPTNG
jgi:hypothetical protein